MTEVEVIPQSAPAAGFSDAISRILSHTGVPRPKRIKREKPEDLDAKPILKPAIGAEIDPDEKKPSVEGSQVKSQTSISRGKRQSKQQDPWHVLPEPTERDRERKLTKIATRGVVQLFNAVRAQQSTLEEKLEEAGPSFRKSEQAIKSVTKGDFLDLLKNPSGSVKIRRGDKISGGDFRDTAEAPKQWEVLDDGYMMSNKTSENSDDGDVDSSSDEGSLEEVF